MFAYCLNSPIVFKDSTGSSTTLALMPEALSTASVGPIGLFIAIAVVVVMIVVSSHQNDNAAYSNHPSSAVKQGTWVDDQKKGLEEKLTKSIAKAKIPQSKKYHLHHIVAQNDKRAIPARYILSLLNISVNSNLNLVFVDETVHRRLHTNWYFNTVNYMILHAYMSADMIKSKQVENVTNVLLILQVYINSLNALAP